MGKKSKDADDLHYSQLLLERGHCWQNAGGYLGQAWWLGQRWPEARFEPGLSAATICKYYNSSKRFIGVILRNCSGIHLPANTPVWTANPPYHVTGKITTKRYDDVWPDALFVTDPMLTVKVPPMYYFWGLAQPEAFSS